MITCGLKYEIVPEQLSNFETYAQQWIELVEAHGGQHHGYFLPHEGPNDLAYAYFSFPSLAEYESYRIRSMRDPECQAAYAFAARTGCIRRYDRHFFRPLRHHLGSQPGAAA